MTECNRCSKLSPDADIFVSSANEINLRSFADVMTLNVEEFWAQQGSLTFLLSFDLRRKAADTGEKPPVKVQDNVRTIESFQCLKCNGAQMVHEAVSTVPLLGV